MVDRAADYSGQRDRLLWTGRQTVVDKEADYCGQRSRTLNKEADHGGQGGRL